MSEAITNYASVCATCGTAVYCHGCWAIAREKAVLQYQLQKRDKQIAETTKLLEWALSCIPMDDWDVPPPAEFIAKHQQAIDAIAQYRGKEG